jgi:hypothetical protein
MLYWSMDDMDSLFAKFLEKMDVKVGTMVCQAQEGTFSRWFTKARQEHHTARLRVLPGRCKANFVHAEVETHVGSDLSEEQEILEIVAGAGDGEYGKQGERK